MSFVHTINYDNSTHFVFDSSLVEVSGSLIRLKDLGGATYSTANPTVTTQNTFKASSLSAFTETASYAGADLVKYLLEVDGVNKYWNGSAWATSDGTYDQSNTAAEINSNAAALSLSGAANIRIMAFLHSDDGTSRPTLTTNTITHAFLVENATAISECLIQAYLADLGLDLLPIATYEPRLYVKSFRAFTHGNRIIAPFTKSVAFDSTGYAQISVLETESVGEKLEIFMIYKDGLSKRMVKFEKAIIPNQASAPLSEVSVIENRDFG